LESFRTVADVDMHAEIYPAFPDGWRSAADLKECFLVAAALELDDRFGVSRNDPFGMAASAGLPPRFRYDTFGSLLRFGVHSDSQWRQGAVSSEPEVNARFFAPMLTSGERIGRLPLLAMVWEFTDDVLVQHRHLHAQDRTMGYWRVLESLEGVVLQKHGTVLFMAAFDRLWNATEEPRPLSEVERQFLAGQTLGSAPGQMLAASGPMYSDSLWQTAFRLVERNTPDYYLDRLGHRRAVVTDILDRGAALAMSGAKSIWPGWE
jgi:hypothetical protein